MRRTLIAAAIFGVAALTALFAADQAREQKLQLGIDLMESKGDLAKAMPLFEDAARSSDRAVAARALLYLGDAQERQGVGKARATYGRIVKEFSKQTVIVAAAQQRLTALGAASTTLRAIRLETNNSSDISYETLSPDGQWLGGTDWENGDLVLRNISTGEIRRLVPVNDKDQKSWGESPVLSPDLKQVAYWWCDERGVNECGQLRVMPNQPGAKPRVLAVPSPEYDGGPYPFAWSPDGKRILSVVGIDNRGSRGLAWISATDSSVNVIRTLDVPKGFTYRLSPDGNYITYSAPCRKGASETCIYVLSADGATQSVLVQGEMNQGPVWTPDGSHILFASSRSGTFGLWSVPVREGKRAGIPSLLKADTGSISSIGMTRSGRYFYNYQAGLNQVFVAELDPATGKVRGSEVSITESFVGITPAWSRDGKWLSYRRPHPDGQGYDLVVHSMESGSERTISRQMGDGFLWLLDGSIEFGVFGGGTKRVNISSGEPREIAELYGLPIGITRPVGVLSPDDKLLYAPANRDPKNPTNPREGFETIDATSGLRIKFFEAPGGVLVGAGGLSPDGRTFVYTSPGRDEKSSRVMRIGTDGTPPKELLGSISRHLRSLTWTSDGQAVLFGQVDGSGRLSRIMRIPAEGGQPEFTGISVDGLQDIHVSPDGTKIAYGGHTHDDEVWALDNVLSALK